MTQAITPQELAKRSKQGQIILLDVRTPAEFEAAHVGIARNVPLEKFDAAAVLAAHAKSGEPLYVICQAGGRGRQACEKLAQGGAAQVINVEGGTSAWIAAGLPVVRGRQTISLERQVRIAAGSLVLTGVILALTVHPYFIGLSAFVGAGLVFAGITDTCGMGMMLARMPWNQVKPAAVANAGNACAS